MVQSNNEPAITLKRAAELSGANVKNIQRAKPIVQSGIQELQDMVDSGEVSIRAGSEVAKLPEQEQRKAISGGAEGVKRAAKKAVENAPIKPNRKSSIPNEADIEKENQRIIGNLKTNWSIAPKPIREKFLAWVESTKNSTNA